jgi:hypothetical protein
VFEVLDLSIPTSPTVVSSVTIATSVKGLALAGNYAYVIGSYPHLITVVDISSPTNLTIKGTLVSINGGQDLLDIVVFNGYVFLADGLFGLRVVDVNDPANPAHVTDLDIQGSAFNIRNSGNVVYLGVEQKYFNVADVSNPGQAVFTSSKTFTSSYLYTGIVLRDRKAYFNSNSLQIYDLTDPYAPQKLIKEEVGVDGIALKDNYLYTVIGEIGLDAYDISDSAQPTFVSRTNFPLGMPRDLSLDGNWVVGISNSPYSITLIDISNPSQPVVKDSFVSEKYPWTVTVKDDYVYVAQGTGGVDIFKIHSDGSLSLVTNFPATGSVHSVAVSGNRAFLVKGGSGIDILDVTDPSEPTLLGNVSTRGESKRTEIHDGYMYVADGDSGLTIIAIELADIKANGSDNPVTINTTDTLSVNISFNAGGSSDNADWWLVYKTPSGDWYYYSLSAGWLPGLTVTYQGALFDLSSYSLNLSGLSSGSYTFYFGVDTVMNGTLDPGFGQLYYDSVEVNVSQ